MTELSFYGLAFGAGLRGQAARTLSSELWGWDHLATRAG